jgi:hypothetical protein
MKLVIIESPFAGDVKKNTDYARLCVKDSLERGEAPFASHLIYTQPTIFDDNNAEDRKMGINAGLAWLKRADAHVFYVDLGMSKGMIAAANHYRTQETRIEFRVLNLNQSIVNDSSYSSYLHTFPLP